VQYKDVSNCYIMLNTRLIMNAILKSPTT